uniref:Uncharacterized protein n=1 Tax=Tanacetum cinerariifolium TaxID=118510 RepID=A0A699HAX8_TANCI|nr:hypothetical protein [Tanacetum cinerariifolium]
MRLLRLRSLYYSTSRSYFTTISSEVTTYPDITYPYAFTTILLPLYCMDGCTSELIVDTKTESDESEDEGTNSEDEGTHSKDDEAASEDQQKQAVSAEDAAKDETLGLGYRTARRGTLKQDKNTMPSTYVVGQSSRSPPDQQLETPTETHARFPICTTWEDLEDGIVYMDIECDIPLVSLPVQTLPSLVETPTSPEWFQESPLVSSIFPSLVATPAPAAVLDEGVLLELGEQLELHRSILDEVFSTWMTFRENTQDLGSFGEEIDGITNLHKDSPKSIVLRAWKRRRRHKATSS